MAKRMGIRFKRQHKWAQENLSAFIDGRLGPKETHRLEEHLTFCEVCREDVETLRLTKALLADMPVVRVPRSFAISESAVADQTRFRRLTGAFGAMRTATVTAAVLLLVSFAGSSYVSRSFSVMNLLPPASSSVEQSVDSALPKDEPDVAEGAEMLSEAAPAPEPAESGGDEIAETPSITVLGEGAVSEDLAQVRGPQAVATAVPSISPESSVGYGGGGLPPEVSSVATPDTDGQGASASDDPIVMYQASGAENSTRAGDDHEAARAPEDEPVGLAPEATSDDFAAAPVDTFVSEDEPDDTLATGTGQEVVHEPTHEGFLQGRLERLLRMLTGVFGGLLLISSAGLVWFGFLRKSS